MAGRIAPGADAAADVLPGMGCQRGSKYTTPAAASPMSTSPSAVPIGGANHRARRAEERSCATRLTLNIRRHIARERRSRQSADPEAPCLRFDMARRGPRRSEFARRASVAAGLDRQRREYGIARAMSRMSTAG